jgi:sec-independent protein translocase protein TatB
MLDIGWSELLVIGVVALLVVPPKDLPVLLRTVGKYVGQLRRMATDFRGQFDQALKDAELAEIRDSVNKQVAEIKKPLSEAERSVNDSFRALDAERPLKDQQPAVMTPTPGITSPAMMASSGLHAPPVQPAPLQAAPDQAADAAVHAPAPASTMAEANAPAAPSRQSVAERAAEAWKRAAASGA